jgi:hypothetical protein
MLVCHRPPIPQPSDPERLRMFSEERQNQARVFIEACRYLVLSKQEAANYNITPGGSKKENPNNGNSLIQKFLVTGSKKGVLCIRLEDPAIQDPTNIRHFMSTRHAKRVVISSNQLFAIVLKSRDILAVQQDVAEQKNYPVTQISSQTKNQFITIDEIRALLGNQAVAGLVLPNIGLKSLMSGGTNNKKKVGGAKTEKKKGGNSKSKKKDDSDEEVSDSDDAPKKKAGAKKKQPVNLVRRSKKKSDS